MIDPQVFENPWVVVGLLLAGAGLVAFLAWLLGRPGGVAAWAYELGGIAWTAIRHIRRVFVLLAAATLTLVGIALLVLPGPGMLFLAAALGLLATEFVWARRWIRRLQRSLGALGEGARGVLNNRHPSWARVPTVEPSSVDPRADELDAEGAREKDPAGD